MIHCVHDPDVEPPMALICHCAGVRESAIVSSILEGATTVDDLRLVCGAAADCGGCEMSLLDLLDRHATCDRDASLQMAS